MAIYYIKQDQYTISIKVEEPELHDCNSLIQIVANKHLTSIEIDMDAVDFEDGIVTAGWTSCLKTLLSNKINILLDAPPQILVHNLYRVGYYPHVSLKVINMKEDLPYS